MGVRPAAWSVLPRPAAIVPTAAGPRSVSISEAVEKAPEDPTDAGQRGCRSRRGCALSRHRLVVVGAHDGIHDLALVEGVRSGDGGHEADEHPVAHHLRLESGRAVRVPYGLTRTRDLDPDAELKH